MIHVRRHIRVTASGKRTTVRAHEREADDGLRPVPEQSRPEFVGDIEAPPAGSAPSEDWWADDEAAEAAPSGSWQETLDAMKADMREWRSRSWPEVPPEPMTPEMAAVLGCDTPEGRESYERLRAYRESGYDGPLDEHNRIPDPDDPANARTLETLAHMRHSESR